MVTQLHDKIDPIVSVVDGAVYFNGFVDTDREVVRVLADSDDREALAHTLLGVGARATRHASVVLETGIVERRFDSMAGRFDTQLQSAVETIAAAADDLLDEESGALPRILDDLRSGITGALDGTFDENSRTSAIAKIDTVMTEVTDRLERKVRATVDPAAPDSPMARVTRDIIDTVKDQTGAVLKELRDVSIAVAANTARAEVEAKTTGKGFRYEDLVQSELERVATIHGDLAEQVGRTTGTSGTQNGDHRVTLSIADTFGVEARVVFESKDRHLSMAKTMQELDKAIQNHDALAGVIVFASQDVAPTDVPFSWWGNKAIVVIDRDDPDRRALHLAYAWARWVARRSVTIDDDTNYDLARIEAALSAARRALAKHQSIKACHSAARKKIDEGSSHVADLVDEIDQALTTLSDELNK